MTSQSIRTHLINAVQEVRSFSDIFNWILVDVVQNAKRMAFSIIGFSVASVLARLGTIGLLMAFVHAQTSGKPILVRGYEVPSDTSLATLSLWGGCVLLLAIITGVFAYLAEALSFKLAREAMVRASDRALSVIAAGQSNSLPLWSNGDMKTTSRKAMLGDQMMLMRSMLVLGGVAVPLITLCVFGAVLLYLNTMLTLFLIPAILIYAVPFYILNRGIATASRDYEVRRIVRSRAVGRILEFATQTQYPGILRPVWVDYFKTDQSANQAIDSFRGIILSKRKMAMLQDILHGVVLCVVLVVFGSFLAAAETIEWVPLLAYLFFLRYFMSGMNGTASIIIALNRFAPQIKRLKEFITIDIPTASTHQENNFSKPLCIIAIEPKLDGSINKATPQVGDIIACIGAADVDSYQLRNFCKKLVCNSKQSRHLSQDIVYCGDVRDIPQLRICELITGQSKPVSASIKQAESSLQQMGVLNELQDLPEGIDTILTESIVKGLTPACCYAIFLSCALNCSRKYLVLDWKPLARIKSDERKILLDALCDRVTILVSPNGQGSLVSIASLVVVMDDTAVRGIGDPAWFKQIERDNYKSDGNSVLAGVADNSDEDDMLEDL